MTDPSARELQTQADLATSPQAKLEEIKGWILRWRALQITPGGYLCLSSELEQGVSYCEALLRIMESAKDAEACQWNTRLNKILLPPAIWEQITGITILDPDGWRSDNKDYGKPITRGDWDRRMASSTILANRQAISTAPGPCEHDDQAAQLTEARAKVDWTERMLREKVKQLEITATCHGVLYAQLVEAKGTLSKIYELAKNRRPKAKRIKRK